MKLKTTTFAFTIIKKTLLAFFLIVPLLASSQRHSWDGNWIAPNAKLYYLNVFINIFYDVHPEYNELCQDTTYWAPLIDSTLEGINNASIPTYLLDWMDTLYVPGQMHGTCTRLYGESSFDTLQITGDFMVVNLNESTILSYGAFDFSSPLAVSFLSDIITDLLERAPSLSLFTQRPFSLFRYKNFLIRNITDDYGGFNKGCGKNILGNTIQCIGDGNFSLNPTIIVTHEISHSFFGSNNFHTSGGNHRGGGCSMTFLNIQGGYGLMGAANSGLVCCNGYERWRMHWKHPQAVDYIAARNDSNTQSVVSDITQEDGNKTFLLRDFVTYGDAIRIKLPYKDSVTSSNQYIWLENHQVGNNDKLDFLQYSNTESCRPQGAAGIYAYYQIGRDILEGTKNQVWDTYDRDNLKIIPAEGYYDYELVPGPYPSSCVADGTLTNAMKRGFPNPLCGAQDQERKLFPEESDSVLYVTRELQSWRKIIGDEIDDHLPSLGDNYDAFSTHTKINMGTNPSTNNTKTCHSRNNDGDTLIYAMNTKKDVRTTFLTGLSIEMSPDTVTGTVLVSIRWDDYDITNDCRWTGKIALKDTAVLTAGHTVTLAQNRTVAQTTRDAETGLFAGRTQWTCEAGSYLRQDSASAIVLTENSSLVLKSGSRFEQAGNARLEVGSGCTLRMLEDATLLLRGTIEVDSGGVAYLPDTVGLGSSARIIVRPGGKLVVDGGTLTSASTGEMWQGIVVLGDRTQHQTATKQGTVELKNGAVVENARCGIKTGPADILDSLIIDINSTGGIITAVDATFHNCGRAVYMGPYTDYNPVTGILLPNASSFTRCTFSEDNDYLELPGAEEEVRLWGVAGVRFSGCTFTCANSPMNTGHNYGINAEDAGFTVETYCSQEIMNSDCSCPGQYATHSSFSGFNKAINTNTSGSPFAVTIDEVSFSDNQTGVSVSGNNHASVTRCQFNLSTAPETTYPATGLELSACTGFLVEGNTFSRSSSTFPTYGIKASGTGISSNSLYRNTFSGLSYGIHTSGNNGGSFSGLRFSCNTFSLNAHDIYVASGEVAEAQGSAATGADNSFSSGATGNFQVLNPRFQVDYYYSTGGSHSPTVHTTNVLLHSNASANGCASTLCTGGGPIRELSEYTALSNALNAASAVCQDADDTANRVSIMQEMSDIANDNIRNIIGGDTLDVDVLKDWFSTVNETWSRYSLAETEYLSDGNNAQILQTITTLLTTQEERDEYDNYMAFNALKESLSGAVPGHANWPAATETQIASLQRIAEANTGRSSVMARGVLCFFFGICYVDEEVTAENRRASAKDREIYLPVLTEDTVTYSVAFKVTTKLQEPDPWRLGAESFYRTSKPSDTIIYNDVKYRSFSDNYLPPEEMTYLREETESGRLFRYYPEFDVEVMTCDMTLQPGDTFYFPDVMDYWTQDAPYGWPYYYYYESEQRFSIVDSVSYVKGRKVIWFPPIEEDSFFDIYENFPLCFIEGVGPSYGPFGKIGASDCYLGLLLCVHHNDSLIYMTDSLLGCEQHTVLVSDYPDLSMKLYPNPARNTLHVKFEGMDDPQGTLTVTDITGVVHYVETPHCNVSTNGVSIDVSNLTPGLYVVSFRNEKGVIVRKFVKM